MASLTALTSFFVRRNQPHPSGRRRLARATERLISRVRCPTAPWSGLGRPPSSPAPRDGGGIAALHSGGAFPRGQECGDGIGGRSFLGRNSLSRSCGGESQAMSSRMCRSLFERRRSSGIRPLLRHGRLRQDRTVRTDRGRCRPAPTSRTPAIRSSLGPLLEHVAGRSIADGVGDFPLVAEGAQTCRRNFGCRESYLSADFDPFRR